MVWEQVAREPHLSEDFMREHRNVLDWRLLVLHQPLSITFVGEMRTYVDDNLLDIYYKNGTTYVENGIEFIDFHRCVDDMPIEILSLRKREHMILTANGIRTMRDIQSFTQEKILTFPKMGKQSLFHVISCLEEFDIVLERIF